MHRARGFQNSFSTNNAAQQSSFQVSVPGPTIGGTNSTQTLPRCSDGFQFLGRQKVFLFVQEVAYNIIGYRYPRASTDRS
jgi:hypothetical protein